MSANCKQCGAPREAGVVVCPYCRTGYDENALARAIPCPKCKHLNPEGSQKCARCQTWVVVQCVFCSALTAYNQPHCHRCGEAFLGSQERFRAMQQQREQAHREYRNDQIAGTVGNAAAGFLGVMAGSMVANAVSNPFDHGGYVEQHYDLGQPAFDQSAYEENTEEYCVDDDNDGDYDDAGDYDDDGGDFF